MDITIDFGKEKIKIPVKRVSNLGMLRGLMFRTKETKNLLFEFSKPTRMGIHSFFVFFKFLAIWVDNENKILEKKIVKPFSLSFKPKKPFFKLIEIPLNNKNKQILNFSSVGKI